MHRTGNQALPRAGLPFEEETRVACRVTRARSRSAYRMARLRPRTLLNPAGISGSSPTSASRAQVQRVEPIEIAAPDSANASRIRTPLSQVPLVRLRFSSNPLRRGVAANRLHPAHRRVREPEGRRLAGAYCPAVGHVLRASGVRATLDGKAKADWAAAPGFSAPSRSSGWPAPSVGQRTEAPRPRLRPN